MLSGAIICRNNEGTIGACLESLYHAVDEVVVMDTGSTDATITEVQLHGSSVVERAWPDSFAAARNMVMDLCKGEWVLWLDSDEVLPRAAACILRDAVKSETREDVGGFLADTRNPLIGGGGVLGAVNELVRVYRRVEGLRWVGRVHEQIGMPLQDLGYRILKTDAVVEHRGGASTWEELGKRYERDSRLLRMQIEEFPEGWYWRFMLGATEYYQGNFEVAHGELLHVLVVVDERWSFFAKACSLFLSSLLRLGRLGEAADFFELANERVKESTEWLFWVGTLFVRMGDGEGAWTLFKRCEQLGRQANDLCYDERLGGSLAVANADAVKAAVGASLGVAVSWPASVLEFEETRASGGASSDDVHPGAQE